MIPLLASRGTPEPPRVSRHPKQLKLRWDPPQECQLKGAFGATLFRSITWKVAWSNPERSLGGAESLQDGMLHGTAFGFSR